MRVLILGGSGMLGHRLWVALQEVHDTWVTVRGTADPFPRSPAFPREKIRWNVDALVFDEIVRTMAATRPEIIVNCIGLIKQTPLADDPLSAIRVNSMLPHQLAGICHAAGIRLVHISTDCVFSGRKGNYTEDDPSDAVDLYGRTKFLGEVSNPHSLTLRTSIIGRELKARLGLVEWFLAQRNEIRGFAKAIFSGLTTGELASVIRDHVIPRQDLHGVYHVSGDPISKYDLLRLCSEALGHKIDILPSDEVVIDRSLSSARFRGATGYQPPSWAAMIERLAAEDSIYGSR